MSHGSKMFFFFFFFARSVQPSASKISFLRRMSRILNYLLCPGTEEIVCGISRAFDRDERV